MIPYNRVRESIIPTAVELSLIARSVRTIDPKIEGVGQHRGSTQASVDILAAMPLMGRVADSVGAL